MQLLKDTNFDFLGNKWPFIIFSLVMVGIGLGSLALKGGPRYGIDFRGGALVYVKFAERPPVDKIRSVLGPRLGGTPEIQEVTGTNEVIIGTELQGERELEEARRIIIETLASTFGQSEAGKVDINNISALSFVEQLRVSLQRAGSNLSEQQLKQVADAIIDYRNTPPRSGIIRSIDQLANVPGVTPEVLTVVRQGFSTAPYAVRNVEIVGPKVGEELRRQAVYVVLAALAGMLIYIAFRFEWIYGLAAVIAVFHDTIVTVGLFSLLDKEITLTVVAALLTLVGYSMNDTIVIFDRVRENLKLNRREKFDTIVNSSINQTLSRTIMTSGLTLLSAVPLWLFGGPVLNGFAFALVVGIIIGTYSTMFIASPILIFWRNLVERRKRTGGSGAVPPAAPRVPAKTAK